MAAHRHAIAEANARAAETAIEVGTAAWQSHLRAAWRLYDAVRASIDHAGDDRFRLERATCTLQEYQPGNPYAAMADVYGGALRASEPPRLLRTML
ncbi:MAG: hypothetical protein U0K19_03525, partial [Bifidobacteriaceae bacterium]|nr:hypothetical protein [Bifidobacteriaceae bacterium]